MVIIYSKIRLRLTMQFSDEVIVKLKSYFKKYETLSQSSKWDLISLHAKNLNVDLSEIKQWHFMNYKDEEIAKDFEKDSISRVWKKQQLQRIPIFMRKKKPKQRRRLIDDSIVVQQPVKVYRFGEKNEELSLVDDVVKAENYSSLYTTICKNRWSIKNILAGDLKSTVNNAIIDELLETNTPVLVNEFIKHDNPYVVKKSALGRLIKLKCCNGYIEHLLAEKYLLERPDMTKLSVRAKLPPEVIEPVWAFRGDTRISYNARKLLKLKLDALSNVTEKIDAGLTNEEIMLSLPENQNTELVYTNHPFKNHKGFESEMPLGFIGGIKQGMPPTKNQLENKEIRYPTLQRVSHSLPTDTKYKSSVIRMIELLERSRGWDFESKVKAVSKMVEVYNNLAASEQYEKLLDKHIPIFRLPGMTKYTKTRQSKFCKGLKHINSLTTQKPLSARKKQKK